MTETAATPTSAGELPMPGTVEGARQEIADRKADTAFAAKLAAGDATAIMRWRNLHRVAHPEANVTVTRGGAAATPVGSPLAASADAARQEIELLKKDPGFSRALAENQTEAVQRLRGLMKATQYSDQLDPIQPNGLPQSYQPAKAADYTMPPVADPGLAPTPEAQAFSKFTREWMAAAKMPKAVGDAVAREIYAFYRKMQALDGESQYTLARAEYERLQRLWGPHFEDRQRKANDLMREVEAAAPGAHAAVHAAGAQHSAMFQNLIWQHMERLLGRLDRVGR